MSAVLANTPYSVGPILFNADEYVTEFVRRVIAQRFGECPPFTDATALGVLRGGDLVAGCVYHHYRPDVGDISLSVAAVTPRWASREVISTLLAYPFKQLGVRRISAQVRSDNAEALRFDLGIGFIEEGRVRAYYGPTIDMVYLGMMENEYSGGRYGR